MAQPDVLNAPPTHRRWAALARIKGRLVGGVARVPATVRTKLLVAFLAIAALLVLISVLGLQVLGQANTRVRGLSAVQQRLAQYQQLSDHADDLRQALGVRAAGTPAISGYTREKIIPGGRQWDQTDLDGHPYRRVVTGPFSKQ